MKRPMKQKSRHGAVVSPLRHTRKRRSAEEASPHIERTLHRLLPRMLACGARDEDEGLTQQLGLHVVHPLTTC